VFAIGEQGRELEIPPVRFPAEIDRYLAPSVADLEHAALVSRWQRDDERGEHGLQFFGVAVRQEMAALFIDQQLVGQCRNLRLDAKILFHFLEHDGDEGVPRDRREFEMPGIDLPAFSHRVVAHGFEPFPIGSRFGDGNQLAYLSAGEGKGQLPHPFDRDLRQKEGKAAFGVEVSRSGYLREGVEKGGVRFGGHGNQNGDVVPMPWKVKAARALF